VICASERNTWNILLLDNQSSTVLKFLQGDYCSIAVATCYLFISCSHSLLVTNLHKSVSLWHSQSAVWISAIFTDFLLTLDTKLNSLFTVPFIILTTSFATASRCYWLSDILQLLCKKVSRQTVNSLGRNRELCPTYWTSNTFSRQHVTAKTLDTFQTIGVHTWQRSWIIVSACRDCTFCDVELHMHVTWLSCGHVHGVIWKVRIFSTRSLITGIKDHNFCKWNKRYRVNNESETSAVVKITAGNTHAQLYGLCC
jgi:hypothetical protein